MRRNQDLDCSWGQSGGPEGHQERDNGRLDRARPVAAPVRSLEHQSEVKETLVLDQAESKDVYQIKSVH